MFVFSLTSSHYIQNESFEPVCVYTTVRKPFNKGKEQEVREAETGKDIETDVERSSQK